MEDDLTSQFQSYQGLHQVVISKGRMQMIMTSLIKRIRSDPQQDKDDGSIKHPSIRLLDTFFSDSLDVDILAEMFKLCRKHDFEIKILVLDPFSEFAEVRAESINSKLGPVGEINEALLNVRLALREARATRKPAPNTKNDRASETLLRQQLKALQSEKGRIRLEVKFYKVLTEAPTYIVSQFVAKGLIIEGKTAALNPWLILVDDTTQDKDLYDQFSDNFDAVWQLGEENPLTKIDGQQRRRLSAKNKDVFLSHGHEENIRNKIADFIRSKLELNPRTFKDGSTITTNIENLKQITAKCSRAVAILAKEDSLKSGRTRSRQNVIHEVGYCQALYGEGRVIILAENGVDIPSNLDGLMRINYNKDDLATCFLELQDKLNLP